MYIDISWATNDIIYRWSFEKSLGIFKLAKLS